MSNESVFEDPFDQIVAGLSRSLTAEKTEVAIGALSALLDAQRGHLSDHQVREIANIAGRDVRTVWRWRKQLLDAKNTNDSATASDTPAEDGVVETVLDRLLIDGAAAFKFDQLMISFMYLLGANQVKLVEQLKAAGYPMPSVPTVCRRWKEVPPAVRDGARFGLRNRANKLLHIRHSARAANDAWQFDAFSLDILVRYPRGNNPVRPVALLTIDDHSRFITSAVLIPHAMRGSDVRAALGAGFEVRAAENGADAVIGGWPDLLVFDNDQAIVSNEVQNALSLLPPTVKMAPAYTPTAKGKVERVGMTIQDMTVTGLPGWITRSEKLNTEHLLHVAAEHLLSFEQFETRFFAAIAEYNYERAHSSLGGRTPFEAYTASAVTPRELTDTELAGLMKPVFRDEGERKVHGDGLHVFSDYYAHACIGRLIDTQVSVRSWHHRHNRVAVFSNNTFVGMVPLSSELSVEQRQTIMAQRIEDTGQILQHASNARAAMKTLGRNIDLGGDPTHLHMLLVSQGFTGDTPNVAAHNTTDANIETVTNDAATPVKKVPKSARPAKRRPPTNPSKKPAATTPVSKAGRLSIKARNIGQAALDGEN